MYKCEICGSTADIHHIVHKSEGGLDIDINYKYLCNKHHRGKHGPHHDKKVDLLYKIELQKKLYSLLTKEFYFEKELGEILGLSNSASKRLTRKLQLFKEGYKKDDIIFMLMGGEDYSISKLYDLEIDSLSNNIV